MTTGQLTLDDLEPNPPVGHDPADDLDARFADFHTAHPEVFDELVELARQALATGADRLGIGMLWEVLRWEHTLHGVEDRDGFKLNNSLRSRYARHIMASVPDLAEVFETRELRK